MATRHGGPLLNPLKNSGSRQAVSNMPQLNEPGYFVFHDDFVGEDTTVWTTVEDTGAVVSGVLADAPYGVFELAGNAGDNTGSSIQTTNEIFSVRSGTELWFHTRIMAEDADQQDIYVGLTVNFATNPEAVLTAADRIGFQVADGAANLICKTERSGTETSTTLNGTATDSLGNTVPSKSLSDLTTATDPADAAWVKLSFKVSKTDDSGNGEVQFFVDDEYVATHTTNIPDDEYLAAAVFSLNGEAVQNSLLCDYVTVIQSR